MKLVKCFGCNKVIHPLRPLYDGDKIIGYLCKRCEKLNSEE